MVRLLRLVLPPLIFLGLAFPVVVAVRSLPRAAPAESAIPVIGPEGWFEEAGALLRETTIIASPGAALRTLRLLMRTDSRIAGYCHGLAHEIGHAALTTYGFAGAIALHDDLCGSGYVHGIVEEALGATAEDDLVGAAERACGESNPVCYHGVGHGFMAALHGDVPAAMERCRELSDGTKRIKCAEGVYMQYFSPEGAGRAVPVDLETALRMCAKEADPLNAACAYYAPRAYLLAHDDDAAGAVSWCKSNGGAMRFFCMRGVGAMLMKRHINDPSHVEALCAGGGTRDEAQTCVAGMVSYWIVHHASVRKGEDLCSALDESFRAVCMRTVGEGRAAYPDA